MGFLYVMGTDNDLCKVGRTDGRVEERRKQLQTGCPFKITKCWHSDDIPTDERCERIVHAALSDKQTSGEWFSIPFNDCVMMAQRVCTENEEDDTMRALKLIMRRIETLETHQERVEKAISEIKHNRTRA